LLGTGEHLWKDLDLNALGYECHKTVPGERATHVFEEGLVTVPLTPRIALIGDFDESVKAHQGISRALALAAEHVGPCGWEWVHTSGLDADVPRRLSEFQGVWCVPGSPYANTRGAIEAIRFARQSPRPFLGTCGGFQHAMLEYAEAVWGVERAAHAELDPEAADPVVAPLSCGLVEVKGKGEVETWRLVSRNGHLGLGRCPRASWSSSTMIWAGARTRPETILTSALDIP
jgi:CTP synthase (UTP-ammonia lyase)